MACLKNCKYCGCTTLDKEYHSSCRESYLENLLYEIQEELKSVPLSQLSQGLAEEIAKETFKSSKERETNYEQSSHNCR